MCPLFWRLEIMKIKILVNFDSTMFGSAVAGQLTPDISYGYAQQLVANKLCEWPNGEDPGDPAAPAEKSLDDMTAKELKAVLDEKGIEYKAKASKEDLIAAINAAAEEGGEE